MANTTTRRRSAATSSNTPSLASLALLALYAASSVHAQQRDALYGSWSSGTGDVMTGPVRSITLSYYTILYYTPLALSSASLVPRYPLCDPRAHDALFLARLPACLPHSALHSPGCFDGRETGSSSTGICSSRAYCITTCFGISSSSLEQLGSPAELSICLLCKWHDQQCRDMYTQCSPA